MRAAAGEVEDGGMDLRPATALDVVAAPDWLDGVDLRPDRWRDRATRAVVARDGEQVVAAGRIFTDRIHPGRYWVEVMVDPQARGRAHGRRVAEHLATLRVEDKPMCTRGHVSSDAVRFARRLGAKPYRTCPPQQVRTADAGSLPSPSVMTVRGVYVEMAEMSLAWTDVYRWMHADWAPVAAGTEPLVLSGFGDELDLEHTTVVVDRGVVRAAAFVFADGPEPLVVAECRTRHEPAGLMLLRACVRDSLLTLAAAGIATITFDGHDSDPHFRPLLDELPVSGEAFVLLEWG